MKLSELEKRIKDFVNQKEPPTLSELHKEKIWNHVENQVHKHPLFNPVWYWAAASMALLIVSLVSIYQLRQKDVAIASLQTTLDDFKKNQIAIVNNNKSLQEELLVTKSLPRLVDTVYLTKVVYRMSRQDSKLAEHMELGKSEWPTEEGVGANPELPEVTNLQNDVASLEIDYGEITSAGITPWRFTVKYH